MPEAAMIGSPERIAQVYAGGRRERLGREFDVYPVVVTEANFDEQAPRLADVKYLFSTWGMPTLGRDQIARLPAWEALFYAAGSVQTFARPLLEAGITVVSSWAANAVPVAEYTVAQILLAGKGFFQAQRACRTHATRGNYAGMRFPGNFDSTVALLGAGMIGSAVIERLKPYQLELLVFDPFLSERDAALKGVEKVTLQDAFRRGFVVSNHLANLPATQGMLTGELFESMLPNATFINTGRGRTVAEDALIEVLRRRPDLTAQLDVTDPEPPRADSPLYDLENVVLTPHMAGSSGWEVRRMADFAIEEAIAYRAGRPLRYGVTMQMLSTMA
jgi:phosphoglycerate dehydrogenase-like enzyme